MSFKTKRSKPSNCHFLGNVHVPDGEMQKMEYEIASIKSERRREKKLPTFCNGRLGYQENAEDCCPPSPVVPCSLSLYLLNSWKRRRTG
jgi:hypothetical protein